MGRRKIHKPRRKRPETQYGAIANAYQCGHCHSAVSWFCNANGLGHLQVEHDEGCPVLNGAISSVPDTLRVVRAVHATLGDAATGRASTPRGAEEPL